MPLTTVEAPSGPPAAEAGTPKPAVRDWRHQAVCPDEDPELFFPIGDGEPALKQTGQAKAVCGRCPVWQDCLKWALETGQDFGVWGALSEDERRKISRDPELRALVLETTSADAEIEALAVSVGLLNESAEVTSR